mgnify:FL=1
MDLRHEQILDFFDLFLPYLFTLYKFSYLNMLSEEHEQQKANV